MKLFAGLLLMAGLSWGVLAAVQIAPVSTPYTNAPAFSGDSLGVQLSSDGQWALITRFGNGLPSPNLEEPSSQVFLHNVKTGESRLISRSSNGAAGNGGSIGLALSADGRYALFESEGTDLVTDDTNEAQDIFLFDSTTDAVTLISRNGPVQGNDESTEATMTSDGRFVLFESRATNLSENDTNDVPDLFLVDREKGTIENVTLGFRGGNRREAFKANLSADGRYVGFLSSATNVVAPYAPSSSDPQVYVRDRNTGKIYWMSQQGDRQPGSLTSQVRVTTNGLVAFVSSDLFAGPASIAPSSYVYLNELAPSVIRRLPDPAGFTTEDRRLVTDIEVSADGRYVAYVLNYGPSFGPLNSYGVYLYDASSNVTRLITNNASVISTAGFGDLSMAADGSVVTFTATPRDAVSNGAAGRQLYRFDQASGAIQLLSRDIAFQPANDDIIEPVLSEDGRTAAFTSRASNLSASISPASYNAFTVPTVGSQPPALLTVSGKEPGSTAAGSSRIPRDLFSWHSRPMNALSRDGTRAVFTSSAWNITPGDQDARADIFIHDFNAGVTKRLAITNNQELHVVGLSADASTIAVFARSANSPLRYNLQVYNASGVDLMTGLYPETGDSLDSWGRSAALSENGQYLLFSRTSPRVFSVRDLWNNSTVALTPNRLTTVASAFSRGAKYAILESLHQSSEGTFVIDWKNGVTRQLQGVFVGSPLNDNMLVFTTSYTLENAGSLYLYSFEQNSSNLIYESASMAAINDDGTVLVYNEPADAEAPSAGRAVALDLRTNQKMALGLRADGNEIRFAQVPSISPDGRLIAFSMARETNGSDRDYLDVYLYDRELEKLTLVSRAPDGTRPNRPSRSPSISQDGRIVFESLASDLVADDRNFDFDVFVAEVSNENESALRVQFIRKAGSQVLSLNGAIGKRYQIEFRASLSSGAWQTIGNPVTAQTPDVTFPLDPQADNRGFYRVKQLE